MIAVPGVITIGVDPTIELGPATIAGHGLTIAIGIMVGGVAVATRPAGAASTASGCTPSGSSWSLDRRR
jgi:hypothetical protein